MKKLLILAIFTSIIIYFPSLSNFFSSDDWFHLRISNTSKLDEFINFFSFTKTPQSATFYRPLPTQVFFFFFQRAFALNPLPYHFFVLFVFFISLFFIYKLAKLLFKDQKEIPILTVVIYSISATNLTRIYFLSAFQELSLVVFSTLFLISHLKNQKYKSIFLLLALLSKETAVILPLLAITIDLFQGKTKIKSYLIPTLITLIYLLARINIFGMAVGDTYQWNYSLIKFLNTIFWYGLWSLGAPELLVDYIGSGLRPIPRFYTDFNDWPLIIVPILLLIFFISISAIEKLGQSTKKWLIFLLMFVISLLPVAFLPNHKFPLELGIPMIWFSLILSTLIINTKLKWFLIFLYFFVNIYSYKISLTRHYSTQRAIISKKVYEYFKGNYGRPPSESLFEFVNDTRAYNQDWGSSKQIYNSIGGNELFRVLYNDPNYIVLYQDIPLNNVPEKVRIEISSKQFLNEK